MKKLIVALLLIVLFFTGCKPDGLTNSGAIQPNSREVTTYILGNYYFYKFLDNDTGVVCYVLPASSLFCFQEK